MFQPVGTLWGEWRIAPDWGWKFILVPIRYLFLLFYCHNSCLWWGVRIYPRSVAVSKVKRQRPRAWGSCQLSAFSCQFESGRNVYCDKQKFISTRYKVLSTKKSDKEIFMRVRRKLKQISLPIKGEVARSAGRGGLYARRLYCGKAHPLSQHRDFLDHSCSSLHSLAYADSSPLMGSQTCFTFSAIRR